MFVCLSENFEAAWGLQKLSDMAEILHTSALAEYVGFFFNSFFFQLLIFGPEVFLSKRG